MPNFCRLMNVQLNLRLLSIRSSELLSKYFGQTEAVIRKIFLSARSLSSGCILHFDDFDPISSKRYSKLLVMIVESFIVSGATLNQIIMQEFCPLF